MSITKYKMISRGDDWSRFEEAINEAIAEGWEPLGGVCAVHLPYADYDRNTEFYQAMVKREAQP